MERKERAEQLEGMYRIQRQNGMKRLTGSGLAGFALRMVGTPYFYGAKITHGVLTEAFMAEMHTKFPRLVDEEYMEKARRRGQVGAVNVDCSGLIGAYRGRERSSAQLYASAYRRLPIEKVEYFAPGTVLWKPGHVGIFLGKYVENESEVGLASKKTAGKCGKVVEEDEKAEVESVKTAGKGIEVVMTDRKTEKEGVKTAENGIEVEITDKKYTSALMCVEAKGIDYGVILSKVEDTDWKAGLTFADLGYEYAVHLPGTCKGENPYLRPEAAVMHPAAAAAFRGRKAVTRGEGVRWLQWELRESGYDLIVDGIFGEETRKALIRFQTSCELFPDGIADRTVREYLTAEIENSPLSAARFRV